LPQGRSQRDALRALATLQVLASAVDPPA